MTASTVRGAAIALALVVLAAAPLRAQSRWDTPDGAKILLETLLPGTFYYDEGARPPGPDEPGPTDGDVGRITIMQMSEGHCHLAFRYDRAADGRRRVKYNRTGRYAFGRLTEARAEGRRVQITMRGSSRPRVMIAKDADTAVAIAREMLYLKGRCAGRGGDAT